MAISVHFLSLFLVILKLVIGFKDTQMQTVHCFKKATMHLCCFTFLFYMYLVFSLIIYNCIIPFNHIIINNNNCNFLYTLHSPISHLWIRICADQTTLFSGFTQSASWLHCKKCLSCLDFFSYFQPKYLKTLKSRRIF